MSTLFIGNRAAFLVEKFRTSIGLPFKEILSEADIKSALESEGATYRERLFSPLGCRLDLLVTSFGRRSGLQEGRFPNFSFLGGRKSPGLLR